MGAGATMIARMLKVFLIAQLLLTLGLAALFAWVWPGLSVPAAALLALLCLLLFRVGITVQNFTLSCWYRSPTPAVHQPRWWQRMRLFGAEFLATMLTSSYSMVWPGPAQWAPPASSAAADAAGGQLPVLLIHGYGCNRGYWRPLAARLRPAGIAYLALDLEPAPASIEDFVPLVAEAAERLCQAHGCRQVIVVAHSMGGLVARAYLRRHGHARVARLITLATPHAGTALARFGPGHNARQMQRHGAVPSAWLVALAASEGAGRRALITSLFSHHDNIVAPQTSSELAGATNVPFAAIGHVAMGRNPDVLRHVLAEIVRPLPDTALASATAAAAAPASPSAPAAPASHNVSF